MSNQSKMVDRYLELHTPAKKPMKFYFSEETQIMHGCFISSPAYVVWEKRDVHSSKSVAAFVSKNDAEQYCNFKNMGIIK